MAGWTAGQFIVHFLRVMRVMRVEGRGEGRGKEGKREKREGKKREREEGKREKGREKEKREGKRGKGKRKRGKGRRKGKGKEGIGALQERSTRYSGILKIEGGSGGGVTLWSPKAAEKINNGLHFRTG